MPIEQLPVESERSFEDRREELFRKIETLTNADKRQIAFQLIMQYSVEDGLRLGERLRQPPVEYGAATSTLGFCIKHLALSEKLDREIRDDSIEEKAYVDRHEVKRACFDSSGDLSPFGRRMMDLEKAQFIQKGWIFNETPLDKVIDDFYLDLLMQRQLLSSQKKKEKQKAEQLPQSRGELMGERYLKGIEELLEYRYYTGTVKEILASLNPKIGEDPMLEEPTITQGNLYLLLLKNKFNDEEQTKAFKQFEPARVVAYRQLDALKRGAVTAELLKEIRKELPDHLKVERDEKADRYRIVESGVAPDGKEKKQTREEYLAEFEKDALDQIEELMKRGAHPAEVAKSLAGLDSPGAWKIRWTLLTENSDVSMPAVLEGLAGVDSDSAWVLRMRGEREGINFELCRSLAGLDSPDAWNMRERLLKSGVSSTLIAQSLVGVGSDRAIDKRREFLMGGVEPISMVVGLTGVSSSDAMEMREMIFRAEDDFFVRSALMKSLIGLDTELVKDFRNRLILEGVNKDTVLEAFTGNDSEEAWQLRDQSIDAASIRVARSLAGLNSSRAKSMRLAILDMSVYPDIVAEGIAGSWKTFVWRLQPELPGQKKSLQSSIPVVLESKLDLLNIVNHPDIPQIQSYWQNHPQKQLTAEEQRREDRKRLERNPFAAEVVGEMFTDRDAARALLETNPAVPDRAPERLARELIHRMLPNYREKTIYQRAREFFGVTERPSPAGAALDRPSLDLVGAGSEDLSDKRRVLESREPMNELLVTGIYGTYDKGARRWGKVYLPIPDRIEGATSETTLTLENVASGTRVALPIPLEARIIKERVKGITSKGKEIALESVTNSLGEVSVEIPSGIVRVTYSIERPLAPKSMDDPSDRAFEAFVKKLTKEHGADLTAPLARLPRDVDAKLKTPEFKKLSPKEKVEYIESMVRELGWYDAKNEETREEKRGATVEEHIVICEERMGELRRRKNDPKMKGKKFAGVCADFAEITCAALRIAGIPSGIIMGLSMNGTEAKMKDSHATAFVAMPDGKDGIRIISVDGTPNGTTPETMNVARPTIGEREQKKSKEFSAELTKANTVLDEAIKAAQADDEDALRAMTNGRLERAINLILHHEVKASHLKAVEEMLNVYWYGGLEKQEGLTADVTLRKTLESAIASQRTTAKERAADEDAGTRLLESVRTFISKFQKGRNTNRAQAFKTIQHLSDLASGELTSVERRALIATIGYLKAEKMR